MLGLSALLPTVSDSVTEAIRYIAQRVGDFLPALAAESDSAKAERLCSLLSRGVSFAERKHRGRVAADVARGMSADLSFHDEGSDAAKVVVAVSLGRGVSTTFTSPSCGTFGTIEGREGGRGGAGKHSSSSSPSSTPPDPAVTADEDRRASLLLTVHAELENIGLALRCPLCLSTLSEPALLPCLHAFCSPCIRASMASCRRITGGRRRRGADDSPEMSFGDGCPVCKVRCTKRGIVKSDHLADLARGYKMALRAFGMVPIVHDPSVNMTQLPPEAVDVDYDEAKVEGKGGEEAGRGGGTGGQQQRSRGPQASILGRRKEKEDKKKTGADPSSSSAPSLMECHEHLEVTRTMHLVLARAADKEAAAVTVSDVRTDSSRGNRRTKSARAAVQRAAKLVSSEERARAATERMERTNRVRRLDSLLKEQGRVVEADERAIVRASVAAYKKRALGSGSDEGKKAKTGESAKGSGSALTDQAVGEDGPSADRTIPVRDVYISAEKEQDISNITMHDIVLSTPLPRDVSAVAVTNIASAVDRNAVLQDVDGGDFKDRDIAAAAPDEDERKSKDRKLTQMQDSIVIVNDGNAVDRSARMQTQDSTVVVHDVNTALRTMRTQTQDSTVIVNDGNTVLKMTRTQTQTSQDSPVVVNDGGTVLRMAQSQTQTQDSTVVVNDGNTVLRTMRTQTQDSTVLVNDGNTVLKMTGTQTSQDSTVAVNDGNTVLRSQQDSPIVVNDGNCLHDLGASFVDKEEKADCGSGDNENGGQSSLPLKDRFKLSITQDARDQEAADRSWDALQDEDEEEKRRLMTEKEVDAVGFLGPDLEPEPEFKPGLEMEKTVKGVGVEALRGKEERAVSVCLEGGGSEDVAKVNDLEGEAAIAFPGAGNNIVVKDVDSPAQHVCDVDGQGQPASDDLGPNACAEKAGEERDVTGGAGVETARRPLLKIGLVVHVQSRTWPGVNKLGGVARITRVKGDACTGVRYDVKYVLGGRERDVDAAFVRVHEEGQGEFVSPIKKRREASGDKPAVRGRVDTGARVTRGRGARRGKDGVTSGGSSDVTSFPGRMEKENISPFEAEIETKQVSDEPLGKSGASKARRGREKRKSTISELNPNNGKRLKKTKAVVHVEFSGGTKDKPGETKSTRKGPRTNKKRKIRTQEKVPSTCGTVEGEISDRKEVNLTEKTLNEQDDLDSGSLDNIFENQANGNSNMTDTEKIQLAEQRYDELLAKGRNSGILNVIMSSVSEFDLNLIKVLSSEAKSMGGK